MRTQTSREEEQREEENEERRNVREEERRARRKTNLAWKLRELFEQNFLALTTSIKLSVLIHIT